MQSNHQHRLVSVCVLSAALMTVLAGCGHHQAAAPAKPSVVKVAAVTTESVPIQGQWIATLFGWVNANIQPHVSGYIIRQDYAEGSYVPKDSVLFEIDPRPFQAVLDQAKGQLAEAEAQLGNAVINVNRDIPEAQAKAIPQSQLDTDQQAKLAAQAAVVAAKAAVEQAQLNLGYTKVRSLVGGIAGIAQVQVGNFVSPTTVLTGVSQVNPIKAYFPVSTKQYLEMAGQLHGSAADPPSSGHGLPLELTLTDGQKYKYEGHALFVNRQVDSQTGTIQVVGGFPNPQRLLRPGETATVSAITGVESQALVIPQRAVMQLQGEYQVAVLDANNKVSIHNVQVGPVVGSDWVITGGLKTGARVVVEGAEKLHDGAQVTPEPYVPAAAESAVSAPAQAPLSSGNSSTGSY